MKITSWSILELGVSLAGAQTTPTSSSGSGLLGCLFSRCKSFERFSVGIRIIDRRTVQTIRKPNDSAFSSRQTAERHL